MGAYIRGTRMVWKFLRILPRRDTMEAMPIPAPKEVAPDAVSVDSIVLARLLEEVRNNLASAPTAYDRVHNRHNR